MCNTKQYRDIHETIINELGELRYGFVSEIFDKEVKDVRYLGEPLYSIALNKWLNAFPQKASKIWQDFNINHGHIIFAKFATKFNLKMDYLYFSGITVGEFVKCFENESPSLCKFLKGCGA